MTWRRPDIQQERERSITHYLTIYYPEDFPDYRRRRCMVVPFKSSTEAETYLKGNGFVRCPVHSAWAVPRSTTVHDGVRKRVIQTAVGFALSMIQGPRT